MACNVDEIVNFSEGLARLRAQCRTTLHEYHTCNVETLWQPGDGEGEIPKTELQQMQLKLAMDVRFNKDNKPLFPLANTRLCDSLVYLATKFIAAKTRGNIYPYDFTSSGDIRATRVPSGPPPIIWAHGLPFFAVYRGYYILCGREHASWMGWKLRIKDWEVLKNHPIWSIGQVVAPTSAVVLSRSIDRQQRVHSPPARDAPSGWESKEGIPDIMSAHHDQCTIVPKSVNGNLVIVPLWKVPGYHVSCGPEVADGRATTSMPKEFFTERNMDFDYDKESKKPYANEKNRQTTVTFGTWDAAMDKVQEHHGPIYCPPAAVEYEETSRKIKAGIERKRKMEEEDSIVMGPPKHTPKKKPTMDRLNEYRRHITLGQKLCKHFPKTFEVWDEIDDAEKLIHEIQQLQMKLDTQGPSGGESTLLHLHAAQNQLMYHHMAIPGHIQAIGDKTVSVVLGDAYQKVFAGVRISDVTTSASVTANAPIKQIKASAQNATTNLPVKLDNKVNTNTNTGSASDQVMKDGNQVDASTHVTADIPASHGEDNNANTSTNVNDQVMKDNADVQIKQESDVKMGN